jgi:hypothetical protein
MRKLVQNLAARFRGVMCIDEMRRELAELRSSINKQDQIVPMLAELNSLIAENRIATKLTPANKVSQLVLLNQYQMLVRGQQPLPSWADVEFRAFSQAGEDGLLLFVFALIGMGERRCVEICAGDGIECNTANLIVNHGWNGLLFDGNEELVQRGRAFYSHLADTYCYPPKFECAWITRDNINELIKKNGFEGAVDLLSIDVDGMDYWIWEAIDVIRPRVVIAEIQCIWGADRAVTVPYSGQFKPKFNGHFGVYSGASLPAFVKLSRKKGYRLVGVQRLGFNAVFIQSGIGEDLLPEVDLESCVDRPFVTWAKRELLPPVRNLEWVDV